MSKISLIPDEDATNRLAREDLGPQIDPVLNAITNEDQARAYLLKFTTPRLEAWRAEVRAAPTSKLFAAIMQPETVATAIDCEDQAPFMAAMLAIADEIDLRIPVPLKR